VTANLIKKEEEKDSVSKGIPNSNSTHGVYISKTLSQETIFSNADFLLWSLSSIPLGSSTPALLNKRTHRTCGQPHGIRTGFVLRVDLESTPYGLVKEVV
jgi:hypothetical protein